MKKALALTLIVFTFFSLKAQTFISPKDAGKYVGEKVTVCGKSTTRQSGNRVMINLGSVSQFNVIINNEDLKNFPYKPEEYLTNKNVCITGKVTDQNGKMEIVIRKAESIKLEEDGDEIEIKPMGLEGINRYFEED